MSQSIERELKSLLTKEAYHLLRESYFPQTQPFHQTNYYYDSPEATLKSAKSGLRIRVLKDSAEATLKTPQPHEAFGLIETTDRLSLAQAKAALETFNFPIELCPTIVTALAEQGLPRTDLQQIGYLKTARLEQKIASGVLLVLDESWYPNGHDFELEMEFDDTVDALAFFKSFLAKHHIQAQSAPNKIQRMRAAQG